MLRPSLSLIYIFIAVALWSTVEVVTRTIVADITPTQLSFTRFAIATLCLVPFLPGELRRKGLRLNRHILLKSAAIGFVGIVLANLSYHYSLKYAGAAVVGTVFGTIPLLTLLFAVLLLGESLTLRKFIGLLVGLTGVVAISLSKESATFSLLGLGLALLCTTCVALFTVFVKRFAGDYAGLPFAALCITFGALALAPLVLIEGDVGTLSHLDRIMLPVLYLSVGTTGVTYLLFFKGLEHVDATSAATVLLLKPPLATALAAWVLREPLTWNIGVGLVLTLVALRIVTSPTAPPNRISARISS